MRTISLITVSAIATIVLFAGCSKSQTSDKPVGTLQVSEPDSKLSSSQTYRIVGTGQTRCYSNWNELQPPKSGEPFYGQDAQHPGLVPSYKNNDDGTVSDNNTGLMWVQTRGSKMTWDAAMAGAKACRVGGYTDWRMPTIKELYSLINFNGGFHPEGNSLPYLDSRHFEFVYGNTQLGERPIDCQDWSSTEYIGRTMGNNPTVFGVNFADGRIKGYPKAFPNGRAGTLYARYVRGNSSYGKNDFHDNGNGVRSRTKQLD